MKDKNGAEVSLGATAVLLTGHDRLNGRSGTVKDVKFLEWKRGYGARIEYGDYNIRGEHWSCWCSPNEFVVVQP